jgi:hypothetical protein
LFNDKGEAIGLVSFQTAQTGSSSGDAFAFAVPIELASNAIAQTPVTSREGIYWQHFQSGLALMNTRHCQEALEEFELAKNSDADFPVDKYLAPYVERCNAMIASGESISGRQEELWLWAKQSTNIIWFFAGTGALALFLLVFIVFRLTKRLAKGEKEIVDLENKLKAQNSIPKTLPEKSTDVDSVINKPISGGPPPGSG